MNANSQKEGYNHGRMAGGEENNVIYEDEKEANQSYHSADSDEENKGEDEDNNH
jgi:hypothetical protein